MSDCNKVFVSGCFDVFHSGHVKFLQEASKLGDVYVGIGSDETVRELKQRNPVNNEKERLFMVKQCKYVKDAFINTGKGCIDFEKEVKDLKPTFFFVNEDGDSIDKRKFCYENDIFYVLGSRTPQKGLSEKSSTSIIKNKSIPYRIDLAGGWLDQQFVNKLYNGAVITLCIEPSLNINSFSGFASSTRNKAIDLWGDKLPFAPGKAHKEAIAQELYKYENHINKDSNLNYISGSQDAYGIVFPGVNLLYYQQNDDIPFLVDNEVGEDILQFLENNIRIVDSGKRLTSYNVMKGLNITEKLVKALYEKTEDVWEAILAKDVENFGLKLKEAFSIQVEMFPKMISSAVSDIIRKYQNEVYGYKVLGAGGGGGVLLVTDKDIEGSFKIKVRR